MTFEYLAGMIDEVVTEEDRRNVQYCIEKAYVRFGITYDEYKALSARAAAVKVEEDGRGSQPQKGRF